MNLLHKTFNAKCIQQSGGECVCVWAILFSCIPVLTTRILIKYTYDEKNVPFFICSPIYYKIYVLAMFYFIFFCMCITCCSSDYFFVVCCSTFFIIHIIHTGIKCSFCAFMYLWLVVSCFAISGIYVITASNVGSRAKLCFHMVWNRLLSKRKEARQTQEAPHREYFVFWLFLVSC